MRFFDKGLSSDFSTKQGGNGSYLSAKKREKYKRLRKWNNRNKVSDSENRNYSKAFNELERICSQLQLSKSVKEHSATLYRKIRKHGLMDGCSINAMISACVYTVCRMRHIPIKRDEIVSLSCVRPADEQKVIKILRCANKDCRKKYTFTRYDLPDSYKCDSCGNVMKNLTKYDFHCVIEKKEYKPNSSEIHNCLKRINEMFEKTNKTMETVDPSIYLDRFAEKLDLPYIVVSKARKLLKEIKKTSIVQGKNPCGVAGACLRIIGELEGEKRTLKQFSDIVGVTEITIQSRINEIQQRYNILV